MKNFARYISFNVKCNYQADPWVIREDLTWEKDTVLERSIIITDSSIVMLRNCRVHLPSEAKIVVERGSTLVLDGCTLTSACNSMIPWCMLSHMSSRMTN